MYKKATNLTVKRCKFTISIGEAIINIRFCCTFFAEWKTINNKTMVSSPNRRKAVDCVVAFNQVLTITTDMLYDEARQSYVKKQSQLLINLISANSPNDNKLVGRLVIDLGKVANSEDYYEQKSYPLEYCAVKANVSLCLAIGRAIVSAVPLESLDSRQFGYLSETCRDIYYIQGNRKAAHGFTRDKKENNCVIENDKVIAAESEANSIAIRQKTGKQSQVLQKTHVNEISELTIKDVIKKQNKLKSGNSLLQGQYFIKAVTINTSENGLISRATTNDWLLSEQQPSSISAKTKTENAKSITHQLQIAVYTPVNYSKIVATTELSSLQEEILTMRKESASLKEQLEQLRDSSAIIETSLKSQIQRLTNTASDEKQQHNYREAALKMEINNAINSLSQLTSAMEQEKANFNEQLETVQSQLVSTCDQMAKDEALITKLCDEISRLQKVTAPSTLSTLSCELESVKAQLGKQLKDSQFYKQFYQDTLEREQQSQASIHQLLKKLQETEKKLVKEIEINFALQEKIRELEQGRLIQKDLQIEKERWELEKGEYIDKISNIEKSLADEKDKTRQILDESNRGRLKENQIWQTQVNRLKQQMVLKQAHIEAIEQTLNKDKLIIAEKQLKELELESSLENTSMKVAQLQEQVADGELVMRNMDAEKVNIEHRLTSVESELIVLRNQYRQSSEQMARISEKHKQLEQQRYQLQQQKTKLMTQMEQLGKDHQTTLQELVSRHKARQMQSKVELEAVNNDFKLLNIQAEQLRQRLKKVSQCEERLDKYLQMETQMRENVAILEHESAQIINLIQEKQENEDRLEAALNQLTALNEQKGKQNSELLDALTQCQSRCKQLQLQLQQVHNHQNAMQIHEVKSNKAYHELEAKNKLLINLLQANKMLLIDSERDKKYIQELKERVGESEIRLKFMSFKNDSHQAEEQKLTSEIVNFRGILYEHQACSKILNYEVLKVQKLQNCLSESQQQLQAMAEQLSNLRNEMKRLQQENNLYQSQKIEAEQENELQEYKQQISSLRNLLEAKSDLIQYMESQMENLRQQIRRLEGERLGNLEQKEGELMQHDEEGRLTQQQRLPQEEMMNRLRDYNNGQEWVQQINQLQADPQEELNRGQLIQGSSAVYTMSQILAQWESLMTSRNNSDLSSALKYLVETRIDSPIMILQLPRYRIIHDKSRAIAKQLQILKLALLKSTRSSTQKSHLVELIQPCQQLVQGMISLEETMAETEVEVLT